jgi:hypothetical protein
VAGWAVERPSGEPPYYDDTSYWLVRYDAAGSQVWDRECMYDSQIAGAAQMKALLFDGAGAV